MQRPLGLAGTAPSRVSLDAFEAFARRQPNNIGWHVPGDPGGPFAATQQLEAEAIGSLVSLLGGQLPEVGGVLTAGGTESNLQALWLGRNTLHEAGARSIRVLAARSAHHSVPAGCDVVGLGAGTWELCGLPSCSMARALRDEGAGGRGPAAHRHVAAADGTGLALVDLDARHRMHLDDLQRRIDEAVARGVEGLLVVATVGSAVTGSIDDVAQIGNVLVAARTRHRQLRTFLHVDAAMAGMVVPFLDPAPPGFAFALRDVNGNPVVDSLSLDLHKAGLAPYPCGVFLCRSPLRTAIEVPRPFDPGRFDATIAGSRPGAAAAAAWATLQHHGRSGRAGARGFAEEAARDLRLARFVAARFAEIGTTVVAGPETNIVAVSFPTDRFDPARVKTVATSHLLTPVFVSRNDAECPKRAYRVVILPHVRRRDIAAAARSFGQIRRKVSPLS